MIEYSEPQPVAWRYRPVDKKSPWSNVTEHRRTAYGRIGMEEQPLYATPSSAGTVSVEAAVAQLDGLIEAAKAAGLQDRVEGMRDYRDALRALAGEGER